MKIHLFILALIALCHSSCADPDTAKPMGPTSDTSTIPWNAPVPGQGGGQLGMLPQNQHRR